MGRRTTTLVPWLLAAGAVTAAYSLWRRSLHPYYPSVALQAGLELLSRPRRVLAIGPHPDDLECFMGGTLKLLAQNGSAVTMAVLSRGEAATQRANIGEIRTKEAESSSVMLGADLIQLRVPDGKIRPGLTLQTLIGDLHRQVQPEVVFAFDPKGLLPVRTNPDHLALGAAILNQARQWDDTRVYFYASPQPNVAVDITEVILEKTNALRAHRSQLAGPDWLTGTFARTVSRLASSRSPAMYTEGFYRLI